MAHQRHLLNTNGNTNGSTPGDSKNGAAFEYDQEPDLYVPNGEPNTKGKLWQSSELYQYRGILSCMPTSCLEGRLSGAMAIQEHAATCSSIIIAYGGAGTRGLLNSVQCLHGQSMDWREFPVASLPSGPGSRSNHCMVSLGEWVFSFGGSTNVSDYSSDMYAFNSHSGTWVPLISQDEGGNPLPSPSARHSASICSTNDGEHLIVSGGRGEGGQLFADLWRCNVSQLLGMQSADGAVVIHWESLWGPLSCMGARDGINSSLESHHPPAREGHSTCVIGSCLLMFSGRDALGCPMQQNGDIEVFDMKKRRWSICRPKGQAPVLGPGQCCSCHRLGRGSVLLVTKESVGIFNKVVVLQVLGEGVFQWAAVKLQWAGDWTMVPGRRHSYCSAMDTSRGSLYIFGGSGDSALLNSPLFRLDCMEIV
ncbi:unnamed protein product [Chrysoparadoxa australica]